jgi:tetratricopeptide (TPR) repeat protein
MACGDSAIALQPDNPDTHCQRANLLRDMGRNDEALAGYDAALRIAPTHADALHGRAGTLHAQGRLDEALATYEAALRARPDFADALSNSAVVLRALGRLPEALAAYDKALALRPDFHDAAVNRSVALAGLGRFDEALEGCLRVLAAKPDHVLALNGAGSAAFSLGRHAAARDYYRQALGVQPDFADGHNNLGTVERELGDRAAAAACFGRAIELRPSFAEPYYNRAIVALDGLATDSAMRDFDACLARDPAHMAAGRGKAMLHLLLGDFKTGWPIYESRWRDPAIAHSLRDLGVPRWTGAADIQGKRILLYAEQGFGDTLQFARYAPLVEALGAKVVLEVQPALKRVLDGRVATIARGETLPAIDFECPLLSVPLALGTDLGSIPSLPAALRVDGQRAAAWNKRLGAKRGLRVGFVASGSTTHKNDANRSVPMARFGTLIAPGRQLVCLQKDLRDSDKAWLDAHKDVSFFGPELGDFADTAALVAGLDLVVSVDTSIAHLAASVGKPTFVLLPFSPDWRWLLTRADSPWYPTMRLFRQPRVGDWDSAFADLLRTVASTEKQMQP